MSEVIEKAEAKEVKKVMRLKDNRRKDIFFLSIDDIIVTDGYNVRTDYGDLSSLEATIEFTPDKLQALRGHSKNGKFIVTDGFRRHRAGMNVHKRTGSVELPVYPEPIGYKEVERLTDMFLFNEGKPLTILEQAIGFQRFRDNHSFSDDDIAKKVHKSITYVRNCFLLLQAPDELKQFISDGIIKSTLVIQLFKEYGIEKAVEIIHDTMEGLKNQRTVYFPSKPETPEIELSQAVSPLVDTTVYPKDSKEEFQSNSMVDEVFGAQPLPNSNPSGTKTDAELGIGGKDDNFHSSDTGEEIKPLMVKITRKAVNEAIDKFDSIGAFRRLWNEYKDKGYAKNEVYEDEFVFVQRILDGAVSRKEMENRYFKFMGDDDSPF